MKVSTILAAVAALMFSTANAQVRGVVGVGLSVPVGDFADQTGGETEAGGGTALAGIEWLPQGGAFGLRVDGAYNRFCTSACDQAGGDLDVRYRFLNANLNGLRGSWWGPKAIFVLTSSRASGSTAISSRATTCPPEPATARVTSG